MLPEPKVQDLEEPVDFHVEVEESDEISSTVEPSVAKTASTVSDVVTSVPEDLQIENDIAHTEEDLVGLPPQTHNPVQEEAVAHLEEPVEIFSTAEPSVAEISSVVSEPATVVPEDLQVENNEVVHKDEDLVDPFLPTHNPVPEESAAPTLEFKAIDDISSAAEPSVVKAVVSEPAAVPGDLENEAEKNSVDPPSPTHPIQEQTLAPLEELVAISSTAEPLAETVVSESATVAPEDLQIENDKAEKNLIDPVPSTHIPVQEDAFTLEEADEISSTIEPLVAEAVISESATAVPEGPSIKNDDIAQAEELVDHPTLTHNLVQGTVAPPEEVAGISSTTEPSVAATVVPEDLQIANDDIAQVEEDLVNPPPLTHNPTQEAVPLFEAVEFSSTEPSAADIALALSEPVTVVPGDLQIENDKSEEDPANPSPPTHNQEDAVVPLEEVVDISSTAEPSAVETVVPEDQDDITQAEEDLVDPIPPTHNIVPEEAVTPLEEAVEISSTAEPSVVEITVSEQATMVPEDLQVANDNTAQAEEDSVDSLPPTHNLFEEEAVAPLEEPMDISSEAEPSMAEIASVVSEGDFNIENVAQAEADLTDPPPSTQNFIPDTPLKETAVISSTAEPSVAETVVPEPGTVPEGLQIDNDDIAQAEVDLPSTHNLIQEAIAPLEEPVEIHFTAEPSVADIVPVVSEPSMEVPEDLPVDNGIAQVEDDLVDLPDLDISPATLGATSTTD